MRWWMLALLVLVAPGDLVAQGAGFAWRASGGVAYGTIATAGPHQDDGQTPAVYHVGIERSLGRRFAVGLDWTGSWFDGRYGRERRHAVMATGSAYVVEGLHARAGIGPGVASWVTVDGPPADGPGDVVIGISEGDPSVVLTAGLGYDVPLGGFQVTPGAAWVGHRLHGATLSMLTVGVRVWLRGRR
jgi:hypothetical protein